MGINPDRVKLVWASAAEGVRFAEEVEIFVDEIKALGPLNWPARIAGNGAVLHEKEAQEVPA
jgi:F420-non-reducing hydrogenase iron-sulfur subunit